MTVADAVTNRNVGLWPCRFHRTPQVLQASAFSSEIRKAACVQCRTLRSLDSWLLLPLRIISQTTGTYKCYYQQRHQNCLHCSENRIPFWAPWDFQTSKQAIVWPGEYSCLFFQLKKKIYIVWFCFSFFLKTVFRWTNVCFPPIIPTAGSGMWRPCGTTLLQWPRLEVSSHLLLVSLTHP